VRANVLKVILVSGALGELLFLQSHSFQGAVCRNSFLDICQPKHGCVSDAHCRKDPTPNQALDGSFADTEACCKLRL